MLKLDPKKRSSDDINITHVIWSDKDVFKRFLVESDIWWIAGGFFHLICTAYTRTHTLPLSKSQELSNKRMHSTVNHFELICAKHQSHANFHSGKDFTYYLEK